MTSIEFKINFIRPAIPDCWPLEARARRAARPPRRPVRRRGLAGRSARRERLVYLSLLRALNRIGVTMRRLALLVVLAFLPASAVPAPAVPQATATAQFETEYGTIVIEFLPTVAPKHVEAFTRMISEGFFDGTRFHRVVPGHFIQGGDPNSRDDDPEDDGLSRPDLPTIPAEFSMCFASSTWRSSKSRRSLLVKAA